MDRNRENNSLAPIHWRIFHNGWLLKRRKRDSAKGESMKSTKNIDNSFIVEFNVFTIYCLLIAFENNSYRIQILITICDE